MAKVKRTLEIDADEWTRFKSLYPQQGAFTWLVNETIAKFNALHDTSPGELIDLVVKDINTRYSE